jgi:hypothetical protein
MDLLASTRTLSDAALLSRLADVAQHERDATAELVAHLVELDVRKLYRAEGHGSLFRYCTDALRLSEHAAYAHIEAGRVARTFPVVLDRLADGSLNLTTLGLLGPHLRPENHVEVLDQAAGRKRDVQLLVARLAPQPDVAASVRKLPAPLAAQALQDVAASVPHAPESPAAAVPLIPANATVDASLQPHPAATAHSFASASHRPVIAPLAPERYRIQERRRTRNYGSRRTCCAARSPTAIRP